MRNSDLAACSTILCNRHLASIKVIKYSSGQFLKTSKTFLANNPLCVYYEPVSVQLTKVRRQSCACVNQLPRLTEIHVVGSKSFRSDIQKPRQMENAVRDI